MKKTISSRIKAKFLRNKAKLKEKICLYMPGLIEFDPNYVKKVNYKRSIRCGKMRKEIIEFLEENAKNAESIDVLNWLKRNQKIDAFPYDFIKKYVLRNVNVFFDSENDCYYVMHQAKKLYFKKGMQEKEVNNYYVSLLKEQDPDSPHRYLMEGRYPNSDDVVADLGAAEGIFALEVIEMVDKVYLFECDNEWIDSLKLTFAPWKDKVVIVNKFVGDHDDENNIRIDTYFKDKRIDYIKADIEGAEVALLLGGEETFKDKVSQVLMCAYHKRDDEENIEKFFRQYGLIMRPNKGYMLFYYDEEYFYEPYLRRGVVYGYRA